MKAHLVNRITTWVIIGPVLLWGVWELVVIALRSRFPEVRTISMEARSIAARGMPSLAYALTGMCAHWWINWRRLPWSGTTEVALAIAWWTGLAIYLASDLLWPESRVWIRHPAAAALIGGVGAWLLFPQSAIWSVGK